MASTSTSPSDYGSWTGYGWKVGPAPVSTRRPETLAYGPGMQYGSIFTYAFAPGAIQDTNIIDNVTPTSGAAAWMPLRTTVVIGDQVAQPYYGAPFVPYGRIPSETPRQKNANGTLAIQLQYPCTLTINTGTAPLTDITWTVFGYDWYMQPMQEMITLISGQTVIAGNKAFYGITGVWFNGEVITPVTPLSLITGATYGLPYFLEDLTHVIQYGQQLATPNPVLPQPVATATFVCGNNDELVNDSTGPDVRGTFSVNNGFSPNGTSVLTATYFVNGASPWKAMMSNISGYGNEPIGLTPAFGNNPSRQQWAYPVSAPNTDSLFGIPQFYRGRYSAT